MGVAEGGHAPSVPHNPQRSEHPPGDAARGEEIAGKSLIMASPPRGTVEGSAGSGERIVRVYEMDGGVRLAGGPPECTRRHGSDTITVTHPPPYQAY